MLKARGFTLIELVLGFVVLGLVVAGFSALLVPNQQQSVQTWQQVRAAELAQSLLNEITARSFDEHSDRSGSGVRCGESGAASCLASLAACPASGMAASTEEATRGAYDDVDDYHCLRGDASSFTDLLGNTLASEYAGYQVLVQVSYAGSSVGFNNSLVKKITLQVTTPTNLTVQFDALKGNW